MKVKRNVQINITTFAFMLTLGACSQPLSHRERGLSLVVEPGQLAGHLSGA